MTVVPRNVLTTKNRSDQSGGVSEDRQWLVTAPYGNRGDVPRGRPVPPGLSTGVQSTCCSGDRTFLSGNNVADYQITRKGSRGLNKVHVCRICEICGHVNKKRKKMSLLKIENFDFEDRNGMKKTDWSNDMDRNKNIKKEHF